MIKLTLVAAIATAGITSSALAHSAVQSHQHVAVHHSSNNIDPPAPNLLYNAIVPPPASQCEQARQVGWPSTHCAVY
jgi:hypothetical protein